MSRRGIAITPDLVLRAYAAGLFPMAEGRASNRLFWLDPEQRGILPLENFHLPRRLARTVLSGRFTVTASSPVTSSHSTDPGCAEKTLAATAAMASPSF